MKLSTLTCAFHFLPALLCRAAPIIWPPTKLVPVTIYVDFAGFQREQDLVPILLSGNRVEWDSGYVYGPITFYAKNRSWEATPGPGDVRCHFIADDARVPVLNTENGPPDTNGLYYAPYPGAAKIRFTAYICDLSWENPRLTR